MRWWSGGAAVVAMAGPVACFACAKQGRGDEVTLPGKPDVEAARELDRLGIRDFDDERYGEALRYFRLAREMGGPASEIWNVVRCLEKLDDAQAAALAIDEYLAQKDVPAADRLEAQREAQALRARPSPLTVITSPSGALVVLDGQPLQGATPASAEIRPGPHTLIVRRPGYSQEVRRVEARYGRPVVVAIELSVGRK